MSQILPVVVSEPPMKMSTEKHSPSVTSRMTKIEMKVYICSPDMLMVSQSNIIHWKYRIWLRDRLYTNNQYKYN